MTERIIVQFTALHRHRDALVGIAAGVALAVVLVAVLHDGGPELMKRVLGAEMGDKESQGAFTSLTTVASELSRGLIWPVLAIVPLGGGIGALMMSVGARMGSSILISSLAAPFILAFVMAAAA